MTRPDFDKLRPGDTIPPFCPPPVSRSALALYAGASCDHNPIHIDIDAARNVGLSDVIAHGMLVMAWAANAVTDWAGRDRLRDLDVRFMAPTLIGARLSCEGTIAGEVHTGGERHLHLDLQVVDAEGSVKMTGRATVATA